MTEGWVFDPTILITWDWSGWLTVSWMWYFWP